VTVQDEACLGRGHNDQSCRGHQCSETTPTGEFRFHISTFLGIKPGSLMTGSKGLTHWTSETVYECSEIAGSPQVKNILTHCTVHLTNSRFFSFTLSPFAFSCFFCTLALFFVYARQRESAKKAPVPTSAGHCFTSKKYFDKPWQSHRDLRSKDIASSLIFGLW
jgi:hypothetical protein